MRVYHQNKKATARAGTAHRRLLFIQTGIYEVVIILSDIVGLIAKGGTSAASNFGLTPYYYGD
ncbi:MAG TPA: hypothetical protein VK900_20410 [Anaerolineales bacterium]|nr:hypothetical protein [Anaerolineales bacterium]